MLTGRFRARQMLHPGWPRPPHTHHRPLEDSAQGMISAHAAVMWLARRWKLLHLLSRHRTCRTPAEKRLRRRHRSRRRRRRCRRRRRRRRRHRGEIRHACASARRLGLKAGHRSRHRRKTAGDARHPRRARARSGGHRHGNRRRRRRPARGDDLRTCLY